MAAMKMLAMDVGTSSVRTFVCAFDGKKLELLEFSRFYHVPMETPRGIYWDMQGIYQRLQAAIGNACAVHAPVSLSLDSWGTDILPLDRAGNLLQNGISTRDPRFEGLKEQFFAGMPRKEIYRRTGIQFLNWNSIYILYHAARKLPKLMDAADKWLFAPDYFLYMLTGEKICDATIASTSQGINAKSRAWDRDILKIAGAPLEKLLPPRAAGFISKFRGALGGGKICAYAGCGHDTAAAVAGIPLKTQEIYIVCGSWAMVGVEMDAPIINESALAMGFSNELGAYGRIRFLKNTMGMYLVQEARRAWECAGKGYSFAQIAAMGAKTQNYFSAIDVNDARLQKTGDLFSSLHALCMETGQEPPKTDGEIAKLVVNSLAFQFAAIIGQIKRLVGKTYASVHIVAGGSQDENLCQILSDVTCMEVIAGPVEASAFGNCAVQMISAGSAKDLVQAREIIAASIAQRRYFPGENAAIRERYLARAQFFGNNVCR